MKTVAYKKTDNGIEKIESNDFNKDKIDSQAILLAEYEHLFNKIDKGSSVLNFVKTKEYKEGLLDVLQNVITELIESKEYLDYDNIKGLLYQRFSDRTIDSFRKESTFDIFRKDYSEYCQNRDYGITKQYLHDITMKIKDILTPFEYKVFKDYHVNGLTSQHIADKHGYSQSGITRIIKRIGDIVIGTDKREGLNIKCLVDYRYTSYNSKGKKRQHKRKVLTRKEIILKSGPIKHVSIEDYQPSKPLEREAIPANKCLQYPTKGYFEKSPFDYMDDGKNSFQLVSTLTYNKSHLPIPVKGYSSKEYRRKKYIRQYRRNLKTVYSYSKPRQLFNGHKSYLYDDGIQS